MFSRNPTSGKIEAYSGDGEYEGHILTLFDLLHGETRAQDGGPGSGNWGHAGRPGLVGGSQAGGGGQYRGGRSDIGYVGSREDWLNGLSGDAQHRAARKIAQAKRDLEIARRAKNYVQENNPVREANKKLKKNRLDRIDQTTSPEGYIMAFEDSGEKNKFLELVGEARSWKDNAMRLQRENLSNEDMKRLGLLTMAVSRKASVSMSKEDINRQNLDDAFSEMTPDEKDFYLDMKAKACGLPTSQKPIEDYSDDFLVEIGEKTPAAKASSDPYDWYKKRSSGGIYTNIEAYMGEVIGRPGWGVTWGDIGRFKDLNKKFTNHMAYGKLSPSTCRTAMVVMGNMRHLIAAEEVAGHPGKYTYTDEFSITEEMFNRLSKEEQSGFMDLMQKILPSQPQSYDQLTKEDFIFASDCLSALSLRMKDEQQLVRDFVLYQEKMFTGEVPDADDPFAAEKKAKAEEEKRKAEEWKKNRDEAQKLFDSSHRCEVKKETIKKIRETKPEDFDGLTSEEVSKKVDELGIMKTGSKFVTAQIVPPEFYCGVAKAYKKVIDRFPFLAGEFGGIGDNYNHSRASAGCSKQAYKDAETEIVINLGMFTSTDKIKERYKKSVEQKWSAPVDEENLLIGDVTHEMGHVLQNWLHRVTYGEFKKNASSGSYYSTYDNEVAKLLKKNVLKALGIRGTTAEIQEELSKYGSASRLNKEVGGVRSNTAADEFFSECFTELMLSSKPRRMAVEFGKQLEKFIKDNKITETTTATTQYTLPKLEGQR